MPYKDPKRLCCARIFQTASGIACIYAVFAFLWIYASDRLLLALPIDVKAHSILQTWKGSLFVLVTALLLFLLVRRALARDRRAEMLFRKVVETMPIGIWLADADGKLVLSNSAGQSIWAGSRYIGVDHYGEYKGWWVASGAPIAAEEWGMARAIRSGETSIDEKIVIACFDDSRKTILHSAFPLKNKKGKITGAMVLIQDVTEKTKAEEDMLRFKFSIEQAPEAIFWLNHEGGFFDVNEQACRSLGYTREELLGLHLWDINPTVPAEGWAAQRESVKRSRQRTFETWHRRKDGSLIPVEVSANQCTFGRYEHHVAFVRDITDRKRDEKKLEYQATHDVLTGLANRNLLADRIQQSIIHAERSDRIVAVLLLDLDRFKVINDSLGHSQGDNLLKAVAARLAGCIRPGDTLARLGGDEFVVVLAEVAEIDDVSLMASKIIQVFDQPFNIAGRERRITASIGASLYPRDGEQVEELIRQADTAMYQAKHEGGDGFQLFSAEMNIRAHQTLEMEADLRLALERQEFILHYQPKINLATGRIAGCEALVRWCHPEKGMIPPGAFIPLAEETGQIVAIGAWVMREACRQSRVWIAEGLLPVKIAVNLSARQFRQVNLLEDIASILSETGMDPRWLELELTESMVMHDPPMVAKTLAQLKDLGLGLCLDDFGTGFSSLNYLRRFPVDCLKIDRSFILDVASDKTSASVANSVVAIAHSLGMSAIAEGVETWDQYDFLINSGCDCLQGFLFSKPVPAAAFARLLREDCRLIKP